MAQKNNDFTWVVLVTVAVKTYKAAIFDFINTRLDGK